MIKALQHGEINWPYPETSDVIFFVIFFTLFCVSVFMFLTYLRRKHNEKLHQSQLFLFRLKKAGLTNFQIKLLNNIISFLRLKNPIDIVSNNVLFEKAIEKFFLYLYEKKEEPSTVISMSRELIIMYEKIYDRPVHKKPLETLNDVEINLPLYFINNDNNVFLGKVTGYENEAISVQIIGSMSRLTVLKEADVVKVYIWRHGDAEYFFQSEIAYIKKSSVGIKVIKEFIREREARHPYVDIMLQGELIEVTPPEVPPSKSQILLWKINELETVIRTSFKPDFNKSYKLNFELDGFKFDVTTKIIGEKTIDEGHTVYCTCKFESLSEPAKAVLKNYVYEHL